MANWKVVTPARVPTADEIRDDGAILVSGATNGAPAIGFARAADIAGLTCIQTPETSCFTFGTTLPGSLSGIGRKLYIPEPFTCDMSTGLPDSSSDITVLPPGWYEQVVMVGAKPLKAIDTPQLVYYDYILDEASYKAPFFDCLAFEEGTTACKLAVTQEAKTLIRNALISSGVDVPDTTPFRQYAGKVGEIQTGDLPKSIKVTIYNSIRAEYDVHYFSSVSGQGPQVIHLSKESDVTFSILSDTPISIEGPQNPEPIIRDVLHSIDAVCLTTSAPGTGENYFSFSTNELFDPGKGVISLEVIDQYG